MKNTHIIFTAPGIAEVIEKDMPVLHEGEVLVRSVRDTISPGTERANLLGDPNTSVKKAGKVVWPRQAGYSISGIVEAIGDGVSSVSVGDRVTCSWTKHAKYNVLKEQQVYKLPDTVGFDSSAMVHIATFPLAAIRKCRLEIGESAIVMGQGVLGVLAVKLLKAAGAVPVIAVDPVESKRKEALALGADYALDPFDADFAKTVKQITGGGVNVAIEVTGKGQGLDMVLDCMAHYGRVALLGCTRDSDFSIDYYRKVHGPGVSLIGAHTMARPEVESFSGWWTERDDAFALLNMLQYGRLDFSHLVHSVYAPAEAPEVFARLAVEPAFPVVQFDWDQI